MRRQLSGTRGRILAALCGGERSAGELAAAMAITPSAVRVHMGELERDGLVTYERVIRGVGKPVHRYRLTASGEGLISRAYLPLAAALLEVLTSRLPAEELEDMLREVAHRLADRWRKPEGEVAARVEAAAEMLEALGGIVEIDWGDGGATLLGRCCPVAAVAAAHPQICTAVETLLARHTGLGVRERCDRSGRPACRFDLMSARQARDDGTSSDRP